MHFVCPSFNAVLLSLAHSLFHLVLVVCTRLYKSLCQLVCPSVSPWVRLLVPLYFFGVFEQFKGKKIRPTVRLTDTVTTKSCVHATCSNRPCFLSDSLFWKCSWRGHATVLFFIGSEHKTRFDRQLCSLSILRIFLLRNGKQWYFYFLSYFWR